MRQAVALIMVALLAVLLATVMGSSDAVVSFFWGAWRADLSLNLFLVLLLGLFLVGYLLIRGAAGLVALPGRAQEWRARQRERAAQQQLRDAMAYFFSGRYSRAHGAALKAADVASATSLFPERADFGALAHLLAGFSMHRLQDRAGRDAQMRRVEALLDAQLGRNTIGDGASLLAAEWALDDRDAAGALRLLRALPAGVARRTYALRLKLQAARLALEPQEALKTARLLAKHQGFSKPAAEGLLRSLAMDLLATARDREQLKKVWLQLDASDRRDPLVSARAAELAVSMEAYEDARHWLRPHWDVLERLAPHEREAVLSSFVRLPLQLSGDWLASLEAALKALPLDPWVTYAAGVAMAGSGLWGRSRRLLTDVAEQRSAPTALRRDAWLRLAAIAEQEGDDARAIECYRALRAVGSSFGEGC